MEFSEFLNSLKITDGELIHIMNSFPKPVIDNSVIPIFSKIDGVGLAGKIDHKKGDIVLTMIKDGIRWSGARFLNHSNTPNLEGFVIGNDIVAIALMDIPKGEELTICYANNVLISKNYKMVQS